MPLSAIKAQMAVLNTALKPTPFSVRLAGVDTTVNASVSGLQNGFRSVYVCPHISLLSRPHGDGPWPLQRVLATSSPALSAAVPATELPCAASSDAR